MRDVRMRGFAEREDVEDIDRRLREATSPLAAESVSVLDCIGRALASSIVAPIDVPGFARSAMDGYAVRGEDSFGASDYEPVSLQVLGESLPGHAFEGEVGLGQAVRIMTGAPLPWGADAVVPVELCRETQGTVEITEAVPPLKHVGAVGEDVRKGETLLEAGRRLRPQDAGLLASLGLADVDCFRRPVVDLVSTGDELLPIGSQPSAGRIVDSNRVVLQGLVQRDGGVLDSALLVADRPELISKVLENSSADVLLVSGGSSVGQEDYAPQLLAKLGSLDFHGVTMRPSSPAGGGRIGERFIFLLPGNPVSCLCAYEFFAGPTIRALGGRSREWPHRRHKARLGSKIVSETGRTDYVRVEIRDNVVHPIATSGAAILSSTVRAQGAVIVPLELEGMAEGTEVEVFLYDDEAQG